MAPMRTCVLGGNVPVCDAATTTECSISMSMPRAPAAYRAACTVSSLSLFRSDPHTHAVGERTGMFKCRVDTGGLLARRQQPPRPAVIHRGGRPNSTIGADPTTLRRVSLCVSAVTCSLNRHYRRIKRYRRRIQRWVFGSTSVDRHVLGFVNCLKMYCIVITI
jgi:hypothetical protein